MNCLNGANEGPLYKHLETFMHLMLFTAIENSEGQSQKPNEALHTSGFSNTD